MVGTPATVGVSWSLVDQGAPATAKTGCGSTTVSAAGSTTLTCSATNIFGTGSGSVTIKIDTTGPTQLKAKGLKKVYKHGTKPDKKKIKCKAKDKESGIVTCKVKGLKTSKGTHTATVIATNGAGLVSTKKFKYTIQ